MFKWLRNGPYNMEIMLETIAMHVGIIRPLFGEKLDISTLDALVER